MNFMVFWKKNNEKTTLNSNEYESLSKKFVEISTRIDELNLKIKMLETNHDDLRGLWNRKLNKMKYKDFREEQESESKEAEGLNNSVILPDNGYPFKR